MKGAASRKQQPGRDDAAQQDRGADPRRERRREHERAVVRLLGERDADREEAEHGHREDQQPRRVDEHVGRQHVRRHGPEQDRDQRRVADEEGAHAVAHRLARLRPGRSRDRERADEEHRLLDERVVDDALGEVVEAEQRRDHGEAEQRGVGLQAGDRQHTGRGRRQVQQPAPDQPADPRGQREGDPAEHEPDADVGPHLEPRHVEERDDRHHHVQQEGQDPPRPHAGASPRPPLRPDPRRDRGGDGEGDEDHRAQASRRTARNRGIEGVARQELRMAEAREAGRRWWGCLVALSAPR